MVATPGASRQTKGNTTHKRAHIIAVIASATALVGAASALGAGELTVLAGANPDFLDPALADDGLSWQVMAATQGGLLGYRRTGGSTGATLVADLAEDMPAISADGRTLRFTVRDGVRFGPPASRLAEATDVKASLERMLALDSRGADLYRSIKGADAVIAHRSRVLSGVVADDDARTVVITLTRRDPALLEALALPFASVVPRGTRAVDQTVDPPSGIGPYSISGFDPGSRIVLTPTPGYTARDGLPAGASSRISITLGQSAREAAIAVAKGGADYSTLAVPASATTGGGFAKGATPNTVALGATAYAAIDATQSPFTSAAVRQAVGLALDRAAAARAVTTGARPATRMIPPGTPGSRQGSAARDVARARSLVASAGATGRAVTLWTGSTATERAVAPFVRDALVAAGLRPTLRSLPRNSGLGRSAPHAAIATAVWTQTTPDGSDAYAQLLGSTSPGTPADPPFPAISGDAGLRGRARSADATALGGSRDARWADVDARAVADGRVVPVATPTPTQVTAAGVSGVAANPVLGVLLAPMQPAGGN